jgi:hypothetical protein
VVGTLDGLASVGEWRVPWRRIDWAAACWAALAKPWFFIGPYLGRLALVPENRSALELVRPGDAVATTSYLAPHLSGRRVVMFPAAEDDDLETMERQRGFNVQLFNPQEPGWASEGDLQRSLAGAGPPQGLELRDLAGGSATVPPPDLRGLQQEARGTEHCQRPPLVNKLAKRKDPCWSTGMTKPPEAVTERWRRAEPLQPAAGFC